MLKKVINFLQNIFYYILILLGLIGTSWIIWSRFIRERVIKDIPDILTEYRFWILIYICILYIIVVKNLIKPATTSEIFSMITSEIIKIIYMPLITLDHLIKYNKYIKSYYYKIMYTFLDKNDIEKRVISETSIKFTLFIWQVFPRYILVSFLLFDTIYFHKLEIFYKVILIGILPFVFRYIKYSLNDILEHWIITLENNYAAVRIYEKGYKHDKKRIGNTEAIFHGERVSIREYIEIQLDAILDYYGELIKYKYESFPYSKEEIYDKVFKNKKDEFPSVEELRTLRVLYHELMPKIISLRFFLDGIEIMNKQRLIKWSKIVIFSMYFLCWSFILTYCYYKYPIELNGMKYLMENFMRYLCYMDNPFSDIFI